MLHSTNDHQPCNRNGIPQPSVMSFCSPKTGRSATNASAPSVKPKISVASDACLVPRRQKTPHRKTVVIGGDRWAAMALIASKMLV